MDGELRQVTTLQCDIAAVSPNQAHNHVETSRLPSAIRA